MTYHPHFSASAHVLTLVCNRLIFRTSACVACSWELEICRIRRWHTSFFAATWHMQGLDTMLVSFLSPKHWLHYDRLCEELRRSLDFPWFSSGIPSPIFWKMLGSKCSTKVCVLVDDLMYTWILLFPNHWFIHAYINMIYMDDITHAANAICIWNCKSQDSHPPSSASVLSGSKPASVFGGPHKNHKSLSIFAVKQQILRDQKSGANLGWQSFWV